jgi:hypothetical protein
MEAFGLQREAGMNCPQDAWFYPGQTVLACSSGRKVRNGREYLVVALGDVVTIKADVEMNMPRAEFFRCARLRYAITYASAQGLTIEGTLALHDTSHNYFDWRKLYVGASRARGRDLLVVY